MAVCIASCFSVGIVLCIFSSLAVVSPSFRRRIAYRTRSNVSHRTPFILLLLLQPALSTSDPDRTHTTFIHRFLPSPPSPHISYPRYLVTTTYDLVSLRLTRNVG
ncbi:hypothetical protein DAEQUDRAFT_23362 [Daedalea quercina L-15889]|uniref:Uncharacterized protein n=1 Tax=Daedalea quercina L-15889 TaxID=1314783 RepID=A0A165UMV5_9APHY|nr:hypothetical protein DAEQUDRAFT_23362 [Daedalea quercina L-15889]